MKIIKFENLEKKTEFAPTWSFVMGEDDSFKDYDFFRKVSEIILSKEKHIIEVNTDKYNEYNEKHNIVYDGATGLGANSLTSRSNLFNFFSWEDPEIKILNNFIHSKYVEFLNILGVPRRKAYIQCWANVMRSGEEIKQHIHASHPLTWIGGHVTIKCEDTSTFYVNPMRLATGDQIYESKNEIGKLTLFQNNIPHYTNTHISASERISIAFDIILEERLSFYDSERQINFLLFDNP